MLKLFSPTQPELMKFSTTILEKEVSHAFFLIKSDNPTVTNKTVITVLRL